MMDIRLEACKIIQKVLQKNIFSNKLLKQIKKKSKDPEDNIDLLYKLVKGVVKQRKNLDYIVSQYTDEEKYKSTDLKIKILLYLALYQILYCNNIPDYAAVDESVKLAKKLYGDNVSKFINAVLRNYLRNPSFTYPEKLEENLAVRYSFPEELVKIWLELWGASSTEELCKFFNTEPLLSLRINNHATNKEKLINYFSRRDIELIPSTASKNVLMSDKPHEVLSDVAFSEGYFSIQDASAALVVELMKPAPHESIIDFFAGPGGKATYMSELMGDTGEIIAIDKFPHKIKKIKQAIARLQLSNINTITEDAFNYGPVAPAYDKVLVDVPCSGWGVFQKKAELRWQANQDMPGLLKLQEAALKMGSQFLKQNGIMIYSTCTMNPAENEEQVNRFLKKNKNFVIDPAAKYVSQKFVEKDFLKTLPFKHKIDGSFAARLKRID
jgi:16S rRNA (cytosine967-C5)-methyltransferase